MTEIVLHRRRRDPKRLCELNHIGAGDLATPHFGNIVLHDGPQDLCFAAADLLLRFLKVAIDHVTELWVLAGAVESAGFA